MKKYAQGGLTTAKRHKNKKKKWSSKGGKTTAQRNPGKAKEWGRIGALKRWKKLSTG